MSLGRVVGLPLLGAQVRWPGTGGVSSPGLAHSPLTPALLLSSRLRPGVEQELRAVRLLRALWDHSAAGTQGARSGLPCGGGSRASAKRRFWGFSFTPPLEPSASAWTFSSLLRNHWIFLRASSGGLERRVPRGSATRWVPTFLPPSRVSFDGDKSQGWLQPGHYLISLPPKQRPASPVSCVSPSP